MENTANHITLTGTLASLPEYSHQNHERRFFRFLLAVERLSGTEDLLPVLAAEDVLEQAELFEGERFTPKNTRHCVNSLSLEFIPEKTSECTEEAIFAGGCFWGVEDAFQSVPGVCDAESGYTGGTVPNPTYEQVCTGRTGHAEAVRVTYDPAKVSFEELARLFFEIHDPTQINRQGPDIGTQYRSAIFYKDERQKATALSLMEKLREHGYAVATELLPASAFYPAEAYHQDFTARTGRGGCHLRVSRFGV